MSVKSNFGSKSSTKCNKFVQSGHTENDQCVHAHRDEKGRDSRPEDGPDGRGHADDGRREMTLALPESDKYEHESKHGAL